MRGGKSLSVNPLFIEKEREREDERDNEREDYFKNTYVLVFESVTIYFLQMFNIGTRCRCRRFRAGSLEGLSGGLRDPWGSFGSSLWES